MQKIITSKGIDYFIRPVGYTDLHALHTLYHHPDIQPWLPASFTTGKIMGTAWILKELIKQCKHPQGAFLAITDNNDQLVGACALEAHVPDHSRFEIAFELLPSLHRQGIMSAALRHLIHLAFTELNTNRIDAYTLVHNTPSQSLLISLGFEKEGILKQFRMFRNQYRDVVILGLTRDSWQKN